jgi:hypothetical protein
VRPRCLLWTAAGAGPEGQIAGLAYIAMGECLGRQTLASQWGPIMDESRQSQRQGRVPAGVRSNTSPMLSRRWWSRSTSASAAERSLHSANVEHTR